MANLLETYKNRLSVAEGVYSRANNGKQMDNNRKLVLATVLNNTNRFLTEAFENSVGTQRSDMGMWKKFTLNLTTVALPNLIGPELVIVHPMTSMSGYVTYINYTFGTNKGQTEQGSFYNSPFKLGDINSNYTSAHVVEKFSGDNTTKTFTVAWTPVFDLQDKDGKYIDLRVLVDNVAVQDADITVDSEAGTITLANAPAAGDNNVTIAYVYDNIRIPQNDLPILNAEMKSIPLIAKARRIAVYYSQIAAFQAKTDYGFDLGDQLAEQACGELAYEIDTEIVELLDATAGNVNPDLTWSKTLPVGVSKKEHYEGFMEIVENAKKLIYKATKKFSPNYMLISADVLPILTFINSFTHAPAGQINGPYFAGTLGSLKVFVSPSMADGEFCVGVNGSDMMSSVAVYAPYMAIVPTQLLQYADGGTSQGWSTLYDLKVLNENLIVKGKVVA